MGMAVACVGVMETVSSIFDGESTSDGESISTVESISDSESNSNDESVSDDISSSNSLPACTSCSIVGSVVPNCSKFCKANRAVLRKKLFGELTNLWAVAPDTSRAISSMVGLRSSCHKERKSRNKVKNGHREARCRDEGTSRPW